MLKSLFRKHHTTTEAEREAEQHQKCEEQLQILADFQAEQERMDKEEPKNLLQELAEVKGSFEKGRYP